MSQSSSHTVNDLLESSNLCVVHLHQLMIISMPVIPDASPQVNLTIVEVEASFTRSQR